MFNHFVAAANFRPTIIDTFFSNWMRRKKWSLEKFIDIKFFLCCLTNSRRECAFCDRWRTAEIGHCILRKWHLEPLFIPTHSLLYLWSALGMLWSGFVVWRSCVENLEGYSSLLLVRGANITAGLVVNRLKVRVTTARFFSGSATLAPVSCG